MQKLQGCVVKRPAIFGSWLSSAVDAPSDHCRFDVSVAGTCMLFGDIWLTTRNRAFSFTQQPWNTDHEAQVKMTTEGARAWSLSSNMFMAFSTVCPRDSGCQEMDGSASHHFPSVGGWETTITHTFKIRVVSNKPVQNGTQMHA